MTDQANTNTTRRLGVAVTIALGAIALSAATAVAADLPVRSEAPAPAPVAPPVFTWTGFYVGVNAGWGTGRDRVGFFIPGGGAFPNLGRLNRNGFVGGAQAGYNWQFGSIVLGIETDIQYAGLSDRVGPVPVGGGAANASSRLRWFGSLRPRIGYAIGSTLIYATGGLAYGNPRYRLAAFDGAGNNFVISNNSTRAGWTVGGGIEQAFNSNWSAKLEYGYVRFGSKLNSAAILNAAGAPTGNFARSTPDQQLPYRSRRPELSVLTGVIGPRRPPPPGWRRGP